MEVKYIPVFVVVVVVVVVVDVFMYYYCAYMRGGFG